MFPLSDDVPSQSKPVMTAIIVGLCTGVFLYEAALPQAALKQFVFHYGLVPRDVFSLVTLANWSSLFPFVSHMFLHGGWLHLIGNMWFLWVFGDNVEDVLGKGKYLGFYVVCGMAGALLQSLVALATGAANVPLIGASGAIAGVLGAYLVFFPYARVQTLLFVFFWPLFFEFPAWLFLGYWFFLQVFESLFGLGLYAGQGVAWFAHIGGFLCGYYWAKHLKQAKRRQTFRYWRVY